MGSRATEENVILVAARRVVEAVGGLDTTKETQREWKQSLNGFVEAIRLKRRKDRTFAETEESLRDFFDDPSNGETLHGIVSALPSKYSLEKWNDGLILKLETLREATEWGAEYTWYFLIFLVFHALASTRAATDASIVLDKSTPPFWILALYRADVSRVFASNADPESEEFERAARFGRKLLYRARKILSISPYVSTSQTLEEIARNPDLVSVDALVSPYTPNLLGPEDTTSTIYELSKTLLQKRAEDANQALFDAALLLSNPDDKQRLLAIDAGDQDMISRVDLTPPTVRTRAAGEAGSSSSTTTSLGPIQQAAAETQKAIRAIPEPISEAIGSAKVRRASGYHTLLSA